MQFFSYLKETLKAIGGLLQNLDFGQNKRCKIYLQDQEDAKEYPFIILKMDSCKPLETALPAYEFNLFINLISNSQEYPLSWPDKIIDCISFPKVEEKIEQERPKNMQNEEDEFFERFFGENLIYRLKSLSFVEACWHTAEDRFSLKTQIKYKGSVALTKTSSFKH